MARKTTKKIKIGANDLRAGNFIFHREPEYWKVYDLHQTFAVRVSAYVTAGKVIEMLVGQCERGKESSLDFLKGYAAVMFNFLCSVPDNAMLTKVNEACVESLERNKQMFGVKNDNTAQEDSEALDEVKDVMELDEQAKKDYEKEKKEAEV